MLSKEQISQIENNKNLFHFVVILLEEMKKKGEREMTIVFKNGKVIKRKKNKYNWIKARVMKVNEPIYM